MPLLFNDLGRIRHREERLHIHHLAAETLRRTSSHTPFGCWDRRVQSRDSVSRTCMIMKTKSFPLPDCAPSNQDRLWKPNHFLSRTVLLIIRTDYENQIISSLWFCSCLQPSALKTHLFQSACSVWVHLLFPAVLLPFLRILWWPVVCVEPKLFYFLCRKPVHVSDIRLIVQLSR